MHRILLVEDEENIRKAIAMNLELEQFEVVATESGKKALEYVSQQHFDLLILDIMLPDVDGISICEQVRLQNRDVAIMILSAKDTPHDRILGLKTGADDYLTKPFNPRELTIRARNLLNRTVAQPVVEEHKSVVKFNGWTLDENSRNLTSPKGVSRRLPKGEYRALRLMLDTPGKIFTREQLIRHMTGRDLRPNDRTVDVTIRRIRKHFESDIDSPELISTIHGEGYRFVGKIEK